MEVLAIVTSLALLQAVYFAFQVGGARQKHGVSAPDTTGHDVFERHYRVHQNTMEQLIIFLPAMWMFGYFVDPYWASGIGVVFVASRMVYRHAYIKDPKSRSGAFSVGFVMMSILLVGAIVGAIMSFMD
jgi:glutathione S-transferase